MKEVSISQKTNLRGLNAIIVGGAGGIGACTSKVLAREGANIIVIDLQSGDELVKELNNLGSSSCYIPCNVENEYEIKKAISIALEKVTQIHILVYCSGVCHSTTLDILDSREWDKEININLRGAFLVLKEIVPHMKKNMFGKIVCVGSVAGKIGGIMAGPHYVASKGGLHALVKSTAKNVALYGVNVNAVAPGPVRTNMIAGQPYSADNIPLGRLGEPEDVAEAILFLSSQSSNWITGTILDVNGGAFMG